MPREELTPVEAAVLVAVARGARTTEEIARLLNLDSRDVQEVVDRLVARGLLARRKRKILFITREEIRLTRRGYDALPSAEEKLRDVAEKLRKAAQAARVNREAQPVPPHYTLTEEMLLVTPLLVTMGLLPAAILAMLEEVEDAEAGMGESDAEPEGYSDADEASSDVEASDNIVDSDFDSLDTDFDF